MTMNRLFDAIDSVTMDKLEAETEGTGDLTRVNDGPDIVDLSVMTLETIPDSKRNESGVIVPLVGDLDELFSYHIKEIISIYDDEFSYVVEFYVDASYIDTINYYDGLLKQTEDYGFEGQDPDIGIAITGRVNGAMVTFFIQPGDDLYVNYYVDKTTKE